MCQYVGERETKEKIVVTFSCNPRHPSLSLSFSFSLSSSTGGSVHTYVHAHTHTHKPFYSDFIFRTRYNIYLGLPTLPPLTLMKIHWNLAYFLLHGAVESILILHGSAHTKTRKLCNELIVFQYRYSLNISTMF